MYRQAVGGWLVGCSDRQAGRQALRGRDSVLQLAAGPGLWLAFCMVVPKGLDGFVGADGRDAACMWCLYPTLMPGPCCL